MKKILRVCFENCQTAPFVARKVGLNIKTVYKYFNEWSKEIEESELRDLLERTKQVRIQAIISYDSQLDKAGELLSQVEFEIESSMMEKKPIPRHLISSKLEIMKFISILVEKKTAFSMQPTMDEALEKKIKEIVEKYADT